MNVTAIKTHKIIETDTLFAVLDKYVPTIKEQTVVAVTSKIVGICEGRIVKATSKDHKDELAKEEAEYYLPREFNQYGFMITINNSVMVASAGIDESNSNGYLTLLPKDPQKSVNEIREYLTKKHTVKHIGVILTDSRLTPLRWGVTGYALAYSGFEPLINYANTPDIFGRLMHVEQENVADSLATAATAVMGEGAEQQPLAVITDVPFVKFQDRNPTKKETDGLKIAFDDDVYASLLKGVDWKKGGKK